MSRNSYNRVNIPRSCSRSHGGGGGGGGGGGTSCSIRGFRINPRRLSVKRLRARFASLFRVLSRCRFPYGRALKLLRSGCFFCRSPSRSGSGSGVGVKRSSCNGSQRNLVVAHVKAKPGRADYGAKLRCYSRSNSFYSEAIADCLEFIKRTSVSLDQGRDRTELSDLSRLELT